MVSFSNEKSARKNFSLVKYLFLAGAFFLAPFAASAATLVMSPASGSYTVGQTFSVSVSANSGGQSLNAVSGVLDFSSATLELVSASKSGSIFNLWVSEPSYSNQSGTASFEGVVLNPGYTGSSGRLITYTLKAKAPGTGSIKVTTGSILANDGNGTELFTSGNTASFAITATPAKEPEKPADIPAVVPTVINSGLPAILQIKEVVRNDLTNPVASFAISVLNTKEIFKKYQIRIDQGEPFAWTDDGKGVFTTDNLSAGSHTLLVKTLDNNQSLTGYVDFLIDALEQPKVAHYTKLVSLDEAIVVYGSAKPGSAVTVAFRNGDQIAYQEEALLDAQGKFIVITSGKIPRGTYSLDVFAHNDTGARSRMIAKMQVRVVSDFYVKIGNVVIEGYMLGFILALLALFLVMGGLLIHKKHPAVSEVSPVADKPKRKRKGSVKSMTD